MVILYITLSLHTRHFTVKKTSVFLSVEIESNMVIFR
jgi:hypothetical protein